MSSQEYMKQVLVVLSENLETPAPQLMSADILAEKLRITVGEISPVLKRLDGLGYIQVDPDLQYSLITREGLSWLFRKGIDSHAVDYAAGLSAY